MKIIVDHLGQFRDVSLYANDIQQHIYYEALDMATVTDPTPIALCGLTEKVAEMIIPHVQPEYEVVQFLCGFDDATTNFPRLVAGLEPQDPKSTLGTRDYSKKPQAVVFGAVWSTEIVQHIRDSAKEAGGRKVPYLMMDKDKAKPPYDHNSPEYAQSVSSRATDTLSKLREDGKLDGSDDGIYFW